MHSAAMVAILFMRPTFPSYAIAEVTSNRSPDSRIRNGST